MSIQQRGYRYGYTPWTRVVMTSALVLNDLNIEAGVIFGNFKIYLRIHGGCHYPWLTVTITNVHVILCIGYFLIGASVNRTVNTPYSTSNLPISKLFIKECIFVFNGKLKYTKHVTCGDEIMITHDGLNLSNLYIHRRELRSYFISCVLFQSKSDN